jgi:hypothetical protein
MMFLPPWGILIRRSFLLNERLFFLPKKLFPYFAEFSPNFFLSCSIAASMTRRVAMETTTAEILRITIPMG